MLNKNKNAEDDNRTDGWGFVITRHVNQNIVNDYWKECIRCIRRFHPRQRIIIIDDFSHPEFIDKEEERLILNYDPHISILYSEFKGAGELLPYYYFHKYRWFEYAIFIHDSMFVQSSFSPQVNKMRRNNSDVAFLWSFTIRGCDDNEAIDNYLQLLEEKEILLSERKLDTWKGCFGNMCCIRYEFLHNIVKTHPRLFQTLLPRVKTRKQRMSMERVLSIIIHAHLYGKKIDTFFGDILEYCELQFGCTFGYFNYEDYKSKTLEELSMLPVIKIWSGR